jgi:hypothetical protein
MAKRKINWRRLPLLPIRILMLLPFFMLSRIGEIAEQIGSAINHSRFCPKGLDHW